MQTCGCRRMCLSYSVTTVSIMLLLSELGSSRCRMLMM
jgi:hypothetical protein